MAARVTLGSREFEVLPLTLGGLRRIVKGGAHKHLTHMPGSIEDWTEEHIDAVLCFTHALLVRSEKDLTLDAVEDLVELAQMPTLMAELSAAAGLTGGPSQGEAPRSKS